MVADHGRGRLHPAPRSVVSRASTPLRGRPRADQTESRQTCRLIRTFTIGFQALGRCGAFSTVSALRTRIYSTYSSSFGLTTDDEMMLAFIQYTRERIPTDPNGIFDNRKDEPSFMSIYPNPTDGISSIKFSLEESADVQLTVFNSLGQKVNQVYSGSLSAGQASFEFDASNGQDPNGLYLIQLIVNDKVYSDRLLQLNR